MIYVAVSAILAFCYLYVYTKSGKGLISKIPGPRAWPIVGNTLEYALPPEQLFTFMRRISKKYGGINQVYSINMQAVNIYDPDDMEIILSNTRFNTKRIPYIYLKPWLNEGLLVSNGVKWQQRRKLLTRAFHFNILKKYLHVFTKQAEVLVQRIATAVDKSMNVLPLITETTLDTICETTMGTPDKKDSREMFNEYFNALHNYGQVIAQRICKVWFYIDFIFMLSDLNRMQNEVVNKLHNFTMSIIKYKQESFDYNDVTKNLEENDVYGRKGNVAMLDLLLQNEKEGIIDLNGVQEEVDTFIFEGHDTIATAISFFLMRIANEPSVQEKIFEEIQQTLCESSGSPTIEDFKEMKYLECCIKESLRLYPSVPFITRYISEEVTLSGYRVPAGTTCQIHVFDLHRCDKLYPRPEEFIPERFLPENISQRHLYAYIPFSAGPRNCIGQKFAMLEMKALITSLLRTYRLEPITRPQDLVFKADIVLRTNHPLYVRFCARN